MPHDSPLLRVHTLGSDEGRMQHNELMDLVTKLSDRKVKRLEKKDKLNKSRRKLRLVLSDEKGSDSDILAQEDPSKQGRKIAQIDEDKGITLVQMSVSTASIDFTTANVPVTTAGAEISNASPEVKTAGDSVDDIAAESLVYIRRSATKTKDKGKGIMEESESAMTKTKRQQEQERLGYEAALRLQEQLDEEERQRIARAHEASRSFNIEEWEDIQARIKADEERGVPELVADSSQAAVTESTEARGTKRAAEEELGQQSSKKQKSDELSQEELQQLMIIVPE
ncbi:hypothetical protein Tco_0665469 [Tanacetum coccineum]